MSLFASHLAVLTNRARTTFGALPQIEPQFIDLLCNALNFFALWERLLAESALGEFDRCE
jgi:hypothetical protein